MRASLRWFLERNIDREKLTQALWFCLDRDQAYRLGEVRGPRGVEGYRRLPHSRWGCRTNTTAALVCLAGHPARKKGGEAAAGLDQILGRETRDRFALGFETARILGAERSRGRFTFYAPFDLALSLRLCVEIGAPLSDPRVAELVAYIREARGVFGLWEYRGKPQASRWVSFDILRSLSRLRGENPLWTGTEPRTPFSPYPKREKRY